MTEQELAQIFELQNVAIIAPAGHGKTEMIAELVAHASGRQLLLTHTNAGVDALKKRLEKHNISKERYKVSTIAAFCIRWCESYSETAGFNKALSPLNGRQESKQYYAQLYLGTKRIFQQTWAGKTLKATYTGIIIDEYQDCIQEQHKIFLEMNNFLPIRVLGDPMQGIFSFAGKLVDWNHLEFQLVEVETRPRRWQKSNPALGTYLLDIRQQLLPALSNQVSNIHIGPCGENIVLLDPSEFNGYSLLKQLGQYTSVVYISRWPQQQLNFCTKMPGFFQYDEKQECDELFSYAKQFDDKRGAELELAIIEFASKCVTTVYSELRSYCGRLSMNSYDFSRISKYAEFGKLLTASKDDNFCTCVSRLLSWFRSQKEFKCYRAELLLEMIRSAKYAKDNNISLFDAANHIRKDAPLQKEYTQFKYLSSRTLLSKGLEFDCVIIDMSNPTNQLSAKDFYVAMTRAMKKIYIITPTEDLALKP